MATTNNVTLKNVLLQLATRRKTGITSSEATAFVTSRFVTDDCNEIPSSSIRARLYELEKQGLVQVKLDDYGNVQKRKGAMVFTAV